MRCLLFVVFPMLCEAARVVTTLTRKCANSVKVHVMPKDGSTETISVPTTYFSKVTTGNGFHVFNKLSTETHNNVKMQCSASYYLVCRAGKTKPWLKVRKTISCMSSGMEEIKATADVFGFKFENKYTFKIQIDASDAKIQFSSHFANPDLVGSGAVWLEEIHENQPDSGNHTVVGAIVEPSSTACTNSIVVRIKAKDGLSQPIGVPNDWYSDPSSTNGWHVFNKLSAPHVDDVRTTCVASYSIVCRGGGYIMYPYLVLRKIYSCTSPDGKTTENRSEDRKFGLGRLYTRQVDIRASRGETKIQFDATLNHPDLDDSGTVYLEEVSERWTPVPRSPGWMIADATPSLFTSWNEAPPSDTCTSGFPSPAGHVTVGISYSRKKTVQAAITNQFHLKGWIATLIGRAARAAVVNEGISAFKDARTSEINKQVVAQASELIAFGISQSVIDVAFTGAKTSEAWVSNEIDNGYVLLEFIVCRPSDMTAFVQCTVAPGTTWEKTGGAVLGFAYQISPALINSQIMEGVTEVLGPTVAWSLEHPDPPPIGEEPAPTLQDTIVCIWEGPLGTGDAKLDELRRTTEGRSEGCVAAKAKKPEPAPCLEA